MIHETYAALQELYRERARLLNAIFQGKDADENRRKLEDLHGRLQSAEREMLTLTRDVNEKHTR